MTAQRLLEFDRDMCDYAIGNVRQYLGGSTAPPVSKPDLHLAEWNALDFPTWFSRCFGRYMPALSDYVWAGVCGEVERRSVSDDELCELVDAMEDLPLRLEAACVWTPYPALHRQSVECILEIGKSLTRQTAEEWAIASADFAEQLSKESLSLANGIEIVRAWLKYIRHLIYAMSGLPNASVEPRPNRSIDAAQTLRTKPPKKSGNRQVDNSAIIPAMLSPAGISERFSVSRSTVYSACRAGMLPHYRVPATKGSKGKYLIKLEDVSAWLESLKVALVEPVLTASGRQPLESPGAPFSELNPERLARAWKPD